MKKRVGTPRGMMTLEPAPPRTGPSQTPPPVEMFPTRWVCWRKVNNTFLPPENKLPSAAAGRQVAVPDQAAWVSLVGCETENCSSSVEPLRAVVDELPPAMHCETWSK